MFRSAFDDEEDGDGGDEAGEFVPAQKSHHEKVQAVDAVNRYLNDAV